MRSIISRIVAMTLVASLAGCSGKEGEAPSADVSKDQATSSGSGGDDTTARAEDLAELVDRIVAEADKLPRADFEPAALAKQLGKAPQAHFSWVRDNTRWVPYRGLLRGSRGVMLDRVGSNLDRAILLGDLLRLSGHKVRVAHADLKAAQARELLARMDARLPARQAVKLAHGLNAAAELVRKQTETLLAAVKNVASSKQAEDQSSLAALQDHWWVEYERDGKWIAMDVLPPQSRPGERIAEASSTSGWNPGDEFPAIPEANWHSVEVRIVLERYEAGVTSESEVLKTAIRPAEVLDRSITLIHVPMPWPDAGPLHGSEPAALRAAALAVRKWVPVLQIGRKPVMQSGFGNDGDVGSALTATAGMVGNEVTSSMDMMLGFGGEEVSEAATAEWIDYEIRSPGEQLRHLRRPVFDLLGPARRAARDTGFDASTEGPMLQRAQALLGQTKILLQPCGFTEDFISSVASAGVVANSSELRKLSQERDPAKAGKLAQEIVDRMDIWGPLPAYAHWRSELGSESGSWFIDRPNVLNYRVSQSVMGATGASTNHLMDVASNEIGIRPGVGGGSFEIRVQQGVADTVAEMLAVGSDLANAANTASIFQRLSAANSHGFVINARDVAATRELPWPDDERARIAADIGAGYIAFVPRQVVEIDGEPHVGWWRIHPMSGETIGVMDTGYHTAAEDAALANALDALRRKLFAAYLAAGAAGPLAPLVNKLLQRMDTYIEYISRSSR